MEYAKTAWHIDNLMAQMHHPDDSVRMHVDGDDIVCRPSINEEKAMNGEAVPYGSKWYKHSNGPEITTQRIRHTTN